MSRKFAVVLLAIIGIFISTQIASAATVTGSPSPNARVGTPYSAPFTATYGTGESGDFTWSETGYVPGLSLSPIPPSPYSTATLSGTPTVTGTYTLTINAYPGTGAGGSYGPFQITVIDNLGSVSPTSIGTGKEGTPVSVQFSVSGATGPVTWTIVSGLLPSGVSLSSSGLLSGVPASGTAGTYKFRVQATDNAPPSDTSYVDITWEIYPAYIPIVNAGQICYETDITRDASGDVSTTGNLLVKNLETNIERKLTNYSTVGTGAILNPMFTPSGSQILYTYSPDPTTTNFRVYLVNTQATVSGTSQGLIMKSNNTEAIPATINAKYAAISPNYNGTQGLIVFTSEKSDRSELWTYNFATETLTQIRSEQYLFIKHPVFLSSSLVAFVGVKNGMQDIYIIGVDGANCRNITRNTSITPLYDRIQSSFRNSTLTNPLLIYSKTTYQGFSYGKWDVYIAEIDTTAGTLTEYNVTNTPTIDEYSAAFFGDNVDRNWVSLILDNGQMFYEADLISGNRDLWQANYDTINSSNSNVSKQQRITYTNTGLANWSPVPPEGIEEAVTIDQTRLVYTKTSGSDREIFRSDYTEDTAFDTTGVQLTPSGDNAESVSPSIARNGGKVSHITLTTPKVVALMNHDGSENIIVDTDSSDDYTGASVSNDGRWLVSVRGSGSTWGIYAKRTTRDSTWADSPIVPNISADDVDAPSFSPDMTKIVYAAKVGGKYDIYYVPIKIDSTVDDSIVNVGSPINLTNTPTINERMPSFSNTGTKIIYCSDKELASDNYEIFTMDINGSDIEKVVSGTGHMWPIYSPVSDASAGTDIIGYLENNQIYYATLYRTAPSGSASGTNPVVNATLTGITIPTTTDDNEMRFGWGLNRTKGTVVASRTLASVCASGLDMTYQIAVDVDEASIPKSYTISETFSSDFGAPHVYVDSVLADTTLYTNYPSTGLNTLKILFMSGKNGGVSDHLIRITMTSPSTTGSQAFVGSVSYTLNGTPVSSQITGNGSTMVENPYMPVDIYNAEGTVSADGIIQDFDLLYAIDAWSQDTQLTGYGIVWPSDIGNWDNILIGSGGNSGIIPIWADATYKGGYTFESTNPAAAYEMYWVPGTF